MYELETQIANNLVPMAPAILCCSRNNQMRQEGHYVGPETRQLSGDNQQQQAKKTYRKPSVQQYGTLREITQIAGHSATHVPDGGGAPAPSNRT